MAGDSVPWFGETKPWLISAAPRLGFAKRWEKVEAFKRPGQNATNISGVIVGFAGL